MEMGSWKLGQVLQLSIHPSAGGVQALKTRPDPRLARSDVIKRTRIFKSKGSGLWSGEARKVGMLDLTLCPGRKCAFKDARLSLLRMSLNPVGGVGAAVDCGTLWAKARCGITKAAAIASDAATDGRLMRFLFMVCHSHRYG
jgi:hypothetical protein